MVEASGLGRQDYTSGVVLQHCDNGVGGYSGWQVYAEGTFQHQTRSGAIALADTMNAYLRRAGYGSVKQTVDAYTVRVAGLKDDIEAVLLYDSSSSVPVISQLIHFTATTACDVVPDPADTASDTVKIG